MCRCILHQVRHSNPIGDLNRKSIINKSLKKNEIKLILYLFLYKECLEKIDELYCISKTVGMHLASWTPQAFTRPNRSRNACSLVSNKTKRRLISKDTTKSYTSSWSVISSVSVDYITIFLISFS